MPVVRTYETGSTQLAGLAGVAMDELGGAFTGVTSVLTLMEIAVKPLQMQRPDVAEECEVLLANSPNLAIAALDRPAARRAAELRAVYRLCPAGALHLVACLEQGATALLENAHRSPHRGRHEPQLGDAIKICAPNDAATDARRYANEVRGLFRQTGALWEPTTPSLGAPAAVPSA